MKVASAGLLVGAAAGALAEQIPLQLPKELPLRAPADTWAKPLDGLKDALKSLTSDAQQLWDEVAEMFPESFEKASFWSTPKPHTRKHDSSWDYIMRGADVQSVWVENKDGEMERD